MPSADPTETPEAQALRQRLVRNFDAAALEREAREPLYDTRCARLAVGTAARALGASIDILAPGKRGCPYHFHHAQEELFVILEGRGHLRVAGEMLAIGAGDCLFIPPGPEYPHQIVNTSDAPLKYLSIGTRESPEVVEYPDSGKYAAMAAARPDRPRFLAVQRASASLDYWDGEP
jgi:uncharacterized cupin superfamily protein